MATLKEWIRDFNKLSKWDKVGLIIGIIGLIYAGNYVQNNYQNSVTISSLIQSPLCVGQNCSQNITYNNKLDIPKPEFKGTYQSLKKINENLYQTDIILEIISQVPLQKIQIEVIDPDVISIDARQNSMTSSIFGKMVNSGEGQTSISFTNAFGSYVITINTKKQDTSLLSKMKITYQ